MMTLWQPWKLFSTWLTLCKEKPWDTSGFPPQRTNNMELQCFNTVGLRKIPKLHCYIHMHIPKWFMKDLQRAAISNISTTMDTIKGNVANNGKTLNTNIIILEPPYKSLLAHITFHTLFFLIQAPTCLFAQFALHWSKIQWHYVSVGPRCSLDNAV